MAFVQAPQFPLDMHVQFTMENTKSDFPLIAGTISDHYDLYKKATQLNLSINPDDNSITISKESWEKAYIDWSKDKWSEINMYVNDYGSL